MATVHTPGLLARLLRELSRPFAGKGQLRHARQTPQPFTSLTEADFQRRLPVWIALSDFFLDTYSPAFYINTARVWHASGFSRDELHSMLVNEMAPRFYANLTVVAGIWDGFDDGQVDLQMRRQMSHAKKIDWMHRGDILEYLDKVWAGLQPYLDAVEQGIDLANCKPPGSMEEP